MTPEKIVELLNEDLTGELEAILVYVKHFMVIKECEPSREIEEISVDEMRHVEWLGEAIVDLEGEPKIDHVALDFGNRRMEDMFNRDVQLEQGAIKKYKEHIAAIDDPKIKKLLTKILMEEEEHLEAFQKMIAEM